MKLKDKPKSFVLTVRVEKEKIDRLRDKNVDIAFEIRKLIDRLLSK